jgi:hypothetical protein
MLTMLAMIAAALQTEAGQHGEHLNKCAAVCSGCQLICDSCFKHCLDLAGAGQKEHAETAQFCVDCAECCQACATLCARRSPLAGPMLECCATCCEECAESCERFPDDEHMAKCAKTCRDCAKECRDMKDMLGQGA